MPKKSQREQADERQLINWYKWEFLRRNPEYRKDYEKFIRQFGGWFEAHGYWYDQTAEPWGKENFRFFGSEIAPKARVICERWQLRDPLSPDWEFTRSGVHYYKPDWEVFLPTDCSKEPAGRLWDLSKFLLPQDEIKKQLEEYTASQCVPQPDYKLAISVDLRRPLKVLLRDATELIKDRKRRYDRKHPAAKIAPAVRRRLDRYDAYLRVWDLRASGEKFEVIGALVFSGRPNPDQNAKDSFKRAQQLIDGAYKELR